MEKKRKKEAFGFVNLLLAIGLVFFCLIFLGGIGTEQHRQPAKISNEVKFASQIVAGNQENSQADWRQVAEKHSELIIRAASEESHE